MLSNQALNTIAADSIRNGDSWQLRNSFRGGQHMQVLCDNYHNMEQLLAALDDATADGARIVYAPTGGLNEVEISVYQ